MKRFHLIIFFILTTVALLADGHVRFLDLPLTLRTDTLSLLLSERGFSPEGDREFSTHLSGLEVWLTMNSASDSTAVNHLMLTTRHQQGRTLRDDYMTLMKWMRHHYGSPTWESTVRGHAFARWFVSFDHDIVMIATSKPSVEIYFYENHQKRNIDYYAILKHCERYPAEDVPFLTANESVTWKRNAPAVSKKKYSKRRKYNRRRHGRRSRRR